MKLLFIQHFDSIITLIGITEMNVLIYGLVRSVLELSGSSFQQKSLGGLMSFRLPPNCILTNTATAKKVPFKLSKREILFIFVLSGLSSAFLVVI